MVFLANNIVFNFHSGISATTTFLLLNVGIPQAKYEKNPIEITVPLFLSHYWIFLKTVRGYN